MTTTTLITRRDFRFAMSLRVRWAEVDMQKTVFNAHCLMYFDTALADYWRALALPYEASLQQLDGDLVVKKASLDFFSSARYDDLLEVGLKCSRVGNSSLAFTGAIFRGDELLVSSDLVYVFVKPSPLGAKSPQVSRTVPNALRDVLQAFAAGEAMTHTVLGDWAALGEGASQVRQDVFVHEQRIPKELAWDDADLTAVHALARNRLDMPLATGRLLQHAPGVGRIGRMAVNRVLRGVSLGRDILQALIDASQRRGDEEVMLHAQRSAEGFYARLGFVARGEPFEEAGIAHIEMTRSLTTPPTHQN